MTYIHLLLFLALAATIPTAAAQNRLYVNPAATGTATGASWADALTDLPTAIAIAQSGDEVWVAQGTYRPTASADRTISFAPKSSVRLLGGFAGTESDPSQRDWEAHPTVLTGDIGVPGDSTDNCYNVVYLHEPDSATVFDGFTVRDGNADYSGLSASRDRRKCGGGMYIMGEDAEAYPSVRNCRFVRNTARNSGGGVCVNGGGDGSIAPLFFNCRFEDNCSLGGGGGLAYLGASWLERGVEVDSCAFIRNSAKTRGGGLLFQDAERTNKIDMARCTYKENWANSGGGGAQFFLGRNEGSVLALDKFLFQDNTSSQGSAASFFFLGFATTKHVEVNNSNLINNKDNNIIFDNNSTLHFDLLGSDSVTASFENNCFFGNILSPHVFFIGWTTNFYFINNYFANNIPTSMLIRFGEINKKLKFTGCKFANNDCSNSLISGGNGFDINITDCIFEKNRTASYRLLGSQDGNVNIINSVIISNIICQSIFGFLPLKTIVFSNSIISTSGICDISKFLTSSSGTLLTHCYFDSLGCAALPPSVTCGPGMIIGGDPMFVNPDSGDYRLRPCSPLVNAGSNTYVSTATDLAGNPRIRGGTVDIGAYEHQGPALAAAPSAQPSCPGGASGSIGIEVQGACPPLLVAWKSGAASGTSLTGLLPGDYDLTLTDAKGLGIVFSVTVPVGDPPVLAPLAAPVICGDTLGGTAAVSVSGATAPLTFDWGTLGTDSLLTGLPPGLYPVTVTDTRGCTAVGSVQVGRTGNLSVDITAQAISCHGAADGSLTVLPANGKAPFSWNWSNPPGVATPTVGPLGPGTYEGTLTDAFGCSIGWVLPLGQPGPLQPSAFVTDASDTGKADGTILLIPTGGTAPYSALWAGGQTGLLLDSLPSGAYLATVTDANGCTAATPTILVGVTIGTDEPGDAANWQVLPNPATDAAAVVLGRPAVALLRVRLWAADGRLALEGEIPAGTDRVALAVGGLPRGMYFVQVGAAVRKVVLR